jgi:hypothetical protein
VANILVCLTVLYDTTLFSSYPFNKRYMFHLQRLPKMPQPFFVPHICHAREAVRLTARLSVPKVCFRACVSMKAGASVRENTVLSLLQLVRLHFCTIWFLDQCLRLIDIGLAENRKRFSQIRGSVFRSTAWSSLGSRIIHRSGLPIIVYSLFCSCVISSSCAGRRLC